MRVCSSPFRSPCLNVCVVVLYCCAHCLLHPLSLYSMLAEDAIKAAIKDLQDKGAVPKPAQHAEAA